MQDGKISVVIPIYNAEETLRRCVDSALGQTYRNLEFLLVDDGSTDKSAVICKEYAEADPRVRVFRKENGGSSSARNFGIREAAGEYIGFLDADDYIEPEMYAMLAAALSRNMDVPVAQILSREETEDGDTVKNQELPTGLRERGLECGREFPEAPLRQEAKGYFRDLMLHTGDSSFCTKLIRRDFFGDFRFPEGELNEDFRLLAQMTERMGGIVTVPRLGYHIVLSGESNTRGSYNQRFYAISLRNADWAAEFGDRVFPGLEREEKHFYLVQAMWFLLHIPVAGMTRENGLYRDTMKRLHGMRREIRTNPYLDPKYRRNLILLTHFPAKAVKRLHGWWMQQKR